MDVLKIPAGWTLNIREVSNNVYSVRLTSNAGPIIEMTGSILEEIVAQCVKSAKGIDEQLHEAKSGFGATAKVKKS